MLKSVLFQSTDTFFGYYCTPNTGKRLLCLQIPCQVSVVVISALETCLVVKLKKSHKKKISAYTERLKGLGVESLMQSQFCQYLSLQLKKKTNPIKKHQDHPLT